jgi:hypothetical protein
MTSDLWPDCGHQRDPHTQQCLRCEVARQIAREEGLPVAALAAGLDRMLAAMDAARAGHDAVQMHERRDSAIDRIERRKGHALPPEVAPLTEPTQIPCRWFANRESFAPVTLEFNDRGVWCHDPASRIRLLHRAWHAIAKITVEDAEDVRDRVTVLRAASFGLVSTKRMQTPHKCYIVVRCTNHAEFYFEVAKRTEEVAHALTAVTTWFEQHERALHEL